MHLDKETFIAEMERSRREVLDVIATLVKQQGSFNQELLITQRNLFREREPKEFPVPVVLTLLAGTPQIVYTAIKDREALLSMRISVNVSANFIVRLTRKGDLRIIDRVRIFAQTSAPLDFGKIGHDLDKDDTLTLESDIDATSEVSWQLSH